MPKILAARHAFPPHEVSQATAREVVSTIFRSKIPDLDRLLTMFDNSRIERRQVMMPPAWYLEAHTPEERNRIYLEQGLELAQEAAAACLTAAGCAAADIRQVIFISSTGHATPTLDAYLIDRLGLGRDTCRLPIWGLGCAGGAAGLSRAYDFCRAEHGAAVLVVALECCSLTFMAGDLSKKNLVGTSLFADGAAAVLVAGNEYAGEGPEITARASYLFPDSYRIMGWDFCDTGMELVLSPKLPALIKREVASLIDRFLDSAGLSRADITSYLAHPGGARVIDAYREGLGLSTEDLALSEALLRDHGNISSSSVLVVLEQWLATEGATHPGWGLLTAFGPGFSAEMLLLEA